MSQGVRAEVATTFPSASDVITSGVGTSGAGTKEVGSNVLLVSTIGARVVAASL